MENRLDEIIKLLNDNRSKLSALYSLYNSSLLVAENERQNLSSCYDQMIDAKNDLNQISNDVYNAKKSEREAMLKKNQSKIKVLDKSINEINSTFNDSCKKYRVALKDCGSLKTEYKHEVSELCKEFKNLVDDSTDPLFIKGYKQQIRIIKAIFDKIEFLIADYNVKKNKVELDAESFSVLFVNVNTLLEHLVVA